MRILKEGQEEFLSRIEDKRRGKKKTAKVKKSQNGRFLNSGRGF